MVEFILLPENEPYILLITPVMGDKVVMFNSYFYFQISMIVTLILAKTMQLVSMA